MNKYHNIKKVAEITDPTWDYAKTIGLHNLAVTYSGNPPFMISNNSHKFIDMASCSYLGFDTHPHILQGASEAVHKVGALHLTTPRYKMFIELLAEVETKLTNHYKNEAICYITCSAATSAFLPIYASGIVSEGQLPFMIFDKNAHFSINHVKPICGDATEVVTCNHNDLDYIEDMCKIHKKVAYIAEGAYSISGFSPIDDLITLQEKYGLFLYFDDSHALSVIGKNGEGYILEKFGTLNEDTVVVSSLAKAFGACGGVMFTGNKQLKEKLIRYGNSWSQYLNSAGLGAINASLELHKTGELQARQAKWRENLQYIDQQFPYALNAGTLSPTRVIKIDSTERLLEIAKYMFDFGFYVSPLFFPTVAKDSAGIRFMPRADMNLEHLENFSSILKRIYGLIT
ncbi:MAG: aminotransferase class I/II-fold pyridoxal phosphate-dependent enzyme [Neisseriaceae bacterium]